MSPVSLAGMLASLAGTPSDSFYSYDLPTHSTTANPTAGYVTADVHGIKDMMSSIDAGDFPDE
jgi:hypothetical protein